LATIRDLFLKGRALLKDLPNPDLEAKLLLLKSSSVSEEQFYSFPDRMLSRSQERHFYRLVSKRLTGIPNPYLTGSKEFWSIPFKVSPEVMIPRPETELIIKKVMELSSRKKEVIVDIGTGCGNIAVSLAKELPQAQIIATDISKKSLKIARLNASLQQIANITFFEGSFFSPLKEEGFEQKCDFVVSNPPYVSEDEWLKLAIEIRGHEPKEAIVAGKTGIEIIYRLIKEVRTFLKPNGFFILEIGIGQKEEVFSFFDSEWKRVDFFTDLNGIDRVVVSQ